MDELDEELRPKIEKFAEIASRFCQWAESAPDEIKSDMNFAQRILAELNLAVQDLPDGVYGDDEVSLPDVSKEQWQKVRERFGKLPIDGYWLIYDPSKSENDKPVFGLFSDDFADIYRDLKYGLDVFNAGHLEEAVWEWKFNYTIHWGHHLLDAQRAIWSWRSQID